MVVGQYFVDTALTHRVHRDAVGQAVAFVEARATKLQAGQKCFAGVWNDLKIRIIENLLHKDDRCLFHLRLVLGKKIEHFNQNRFGRNQSHRAQIGLNLFYFSVPLVARVDPRDQY